MVVYHLYDAILQYYVCLITMIVAEEFRNDHHMESVCLYLFLSECGVVQVGGRVQGGWLALLCIVHSVMC